MSSVLYNVFLTFNGNKAPSDSLIAVLTALAMLGVGFTAQIETAAGVEHRNCVRLLRKFTELGLATRRMETAAERTARRGLRLRAYYELTPAGRQLTEQIMAGVSR